MNRYSIYQSPCRPVNNQCRMKKGSMLEKLSLSNSFVVRNRTSKFVNNKVTKKSKFTPKTGKNLLSPNKEEQEKKSCFSNYAQSLKINFAKLRRNNQQAKAQTKNPFLILKRMHEESNNELEETDPIQSLRNDIQVPEAIAKRITNQLCNTPKIGNSIDHKKLEIDEWGNH